MLSIESEQRLEEFEAQWDSNAPGRFDEVIGGVPPAERTEMLSELVMIDVEMRIRSGTSRAEIDEYLTDCFRRYPDLASHAALQRKIKSHWRGLHDSHKALRSPTKYDPKKTLASGSDSSFQGPFPTPCSFGEFELLRVIASGGMGTVYEAKQHSPQRTIAIKLVRADVRFDAEAVVRFERETQLIASINDASVVPVLQSGYIDGHHYYTMPFYRSGTLRDRIQSGELSVRDTCQILLDVALAMSAVHALRIVHRDLKPSNILFGDDDRPRIADFGLSRHEDHSRSLTRTGQIYGTPGYIAPERIVADNRETDDFAADQYSLGAILYDMLCGRPPFRGLTIWETLFTSSIGFPITGVAVDPKVDRDLNTICMKCLEPRPQDRYVSCAELAQDLQNYLAGDTIAARPPNLFERVKSFTVRHPAKAGLIAATTGFACIVCVAIFLSFKLSLQQREIELQDLSRRNQTYVANLTQAASWMIDRRMGWRRKALDILHANATLEISDRNLVQARSMIATAKVHPDLVPVATLAKEIWCDATAFDPTGRFLAIGQNKDTDGFRVLIYQTSDLTAEPYVLWVDCKTENDQRRAAGQSKAEDGARVICFSPDGSQMALGTRHGRVHVYQWSGRDAKLVASHDPDPGLEVRTLCFSSSGDSIWSVSRQLKLRIIDGDSVRSSALIGDQRVDNVIAVPNANSMILRLQKTDSVLLRIDAGATEASWELNHLVKPRHLSISPDGRYLAISCDWNQQVNIVDTDHGLIRATLTGRLIDARETFVEHCFGHGGDWLVTVSDDRTVAVWDVAQRRPIVSYIVAERGGRPKIATSHSEPLIAVAEHLQTTVYRIAGADMLDSVAHNAAPIGNIAVDSTGARLATIATGHERRLIRPRHVTQSIWDLASDQPHTQDRSFVYTVASSPVRPALAFSSDAKRLFTTDRIGRPRIVPIQVRLDRPSIESENDEHVWIPASDIRFPQPKNAEQNHPNHSRQQLRFQVPRLPGAKLMADDKVGIGFDVFLLYQYSGRTQSRRAQVRSLDGYCVNAESTLELPEQGSIAIFAGNHRRPQRALEIELSFDQPVHDLILQGALVRRPSIEQRISQAFNHQDPAYVSAFSVNDRHGRLCAVTDDERLVSASEADLTIQSRWKNQSVSHEEGRGTLAPLLATQDWIVAGTTFGEMFVFEAKSGDLVQSSVPLANRVQSLCEISDTPVVAVGGSDGGLHWLELPSLDQIHQLAVSEQSIDAVCYDRKSGWLFAGGEEKTVYVFRRHKGKFELYFTIDLNIGRIQEMRMMEQQNKLAILIKNETAVRLIDLEQIASELKKLELL